MHRAGKLRAIVVPMGRVCKGLVVVASMLALAGCATPGPPAAPTTATAIAVPVFRSTWTDGPWPFTVSEGVLRCRFPYRVTLTTGGVEYALGRAATSSGQFGKVGEILQAGPLGYVEIDGTRQPVRMGPSTQKLVSKGLDLCP